jgi:hypothetical protein
VAAESEARWLLLIHHIPPQPSYLRVKVGRRLQSLGAVAVKNSVYVLPQSEQAREDFQWVRQEIVAGGGDASVCEARFVDGLSEGAVEALFHAARDADYERLAREVRRVQGALTRRGRRKAARGGAGTPALARLRQRLGDIAAIDFFGARGRATVETLLASMEASLRPPQTPAEVVARVSAGDVRGRTWVTRSGVYVDRIASAWLIRRFLDPEARFKFVRGQRHAAVPGELRFDMFEAEFTHEGDLCTFEVLRRRFGLADAALGPIAEIVHDLDLKDARFARPEAAGLERVLAGIALRYRDDESRLQDGRAVFDALYESFKRKAEA